MATATMPRPKRNDIAVKLDADIARKVRTMTSYRNIPMAQYLSDVLRPIVDRDFEKFMKHVQETEKRHP